MLKIKIIFVLSLLISVTACSTREAGKQFAGSTEQRLVTYSINQIAEDFAKEPLEEITNQTIRLESHFVVKNQVVEYATARIQNQLTETFGTKFVVNEPLFETTTKYILKLFYTSLGTDRDTAGFSLPIIDLAEPERSTSISILAVDMYHGVSECNYVLIDTETNQVLKKGTVKARIRTDNFTTPIFSFPLSDID